MNNVFPVVADRATVNYNTDRGKEERQPSTNSAATAQTVRQGMLTEAAVRELLEQQRVHFEQQMAQQQQKINAILSTVSGSTHATTAATSFRTPPSTRVSHLLAPIDPEVARELFPGVVPRGTEDFEPSMQMRVKDVLDTASKFVTPFNGVTALDKGRTVMTFVENVEMVMGNLLPRQSPHRLMIVQMCLKEAALQWLDNHIRELVEGAATVGRDLSKQPVSWDNDVRDQFILDFTGTDMVEMWLAQLAALRLGAEKTKTPVELNIQFDALARHVYPNRTSNNDDLMLAQMYRDIVAASDLNLYKGIMRAERPTTLKEWKTGLARQWNVEEQIRAWTATQKAAAGPYRGNSGGWRGRGGQAASPGRAQSVNAVTGEVGDAATEQGEEHTEEGAPNPQLTAMGSGRGVRGGGRGGSGTRGRGAPLTGERLKLYEEQKCFRCKKSGHVQAHCPLPPTPRQLTNQPNPSEQSK